MSPQITFSPLQPSHFPLLLKWLNTPHVKAWWDQDISWTEALIVEKYGTYTEGYTWVDHKKKPLHAFIIESDKQPIGYIQYYNVHDFPRDEQEETYQPYLSNTCAALDIFIGESAYLRKGIGSHAIRLLLEKYIFTQCDACFVDPDIHNMAAIKAYQKAGFTPIKQLPSGSIRMLVRKNGVIIETERLVLRQWKKEDLEPFAILNRCPHVCEFLPNPLTKEESDAMVARFTQHIKEHGFGLYAVALKENEIFIGFTGLNIPRFNAHFMPAVEIGWRLAFPYWGKGYATEAAQAVCRYAAHALGLKDIVSFTAVNNIRSAHVMEKIGMTHNPTDDFDHPSLPEGHPLRRHVLYRLKM